MKEKQNPALKKRDLNITREDAVVQKTHLRTETDPKIRALKPLKRPGLGDTTPFSVPAVRPSTNRNSSTAASGRSKLASRGTVNINSTTSVKTSQIGQSTRDLQAVNIRRQDASNINNSNR